MSSEYDSDDTSCYDIDECEGQPCHENALCENFIGFYIGMQIFFFFLPFQRFSFILSKNRTIYMPFDTSVIASMDI